VIQFSPESGRSPLPTRLMVGLHSSKVLYNEITVDTIVQEKAVALSGASSGRSRQLKSIIGKISITENQAKVFVKERTQLSPYLEKCCLILSANVPDERSAESGKCTASAAAPLCLSQRTTLTLGLTRLGCTRLQWSQAHLRELVRQRRSCW
jgi:hypothetical protein